MHSAITPRTAHARVRACSCLQGLSLLAADRDLRTVIEQRSGSLTARSSAGAADGSLFTSEGTADAGQSATTSQASEEADKLGGVLPSAPDVVEAQPLQSLPMGTTLGSLKGAYRCLLRAICSVDVRHFSTPLLTRGRKNTRGPSTCSRLTLHLQLCSSDVQDGQGWCPGNEGYLASLWQWP